jgi:hypothetical protein
MSKARGVRRILFSAALCGAALLTQGASGGAEATQRRAARVTGGGGDYALVSRAESITGDSFAHLTRTPRGVRVHAVRPPRAETLRAIDAGLSELFEVARRRGYRARLDHADYTVFVARPDRVKNGDGQHSPDIAIGAAQYAGSVYDQGGFVYAAGMVLSFQPSAFIVAEHERDFKRVADVARYEGEHIILYHNDHKLYRQTLDHSRGGSHPILQ